MLQADVNPTAVEFIQRDVVKLGEDFSGVRYPRPDAGSYILLTFDGRRTEVESALEDIRALTLRTGALEFIPLDDPCYAADIWKKVRARAGQGGGGRLGQEPVDIVVPISRTAEFIRFVRRTEAEKRPADGQLRPCGRRQRAPLRGARRPQREAWRTDLRAAMEKVYAKACELGGVPSGESIGLSKRHYFLRETAKRKHSRDEPHQGTLGPKHILNDQKSYISEGW